MHYPDFKPGPVPKDVAMQRQSAPTKSVDPVESLRSRTVPRSVDMLSEEELQSRFPGGIVPQSLPRRTLGSRMRSRRSR